MVLAVVLAVVDLLIELIVLQGLVLELLEAFKFIRQKNLLGLLSDSIN